jgi:diaminopimelate decarboxylase
LGGFDGDGMRTSELIRRFGSPAYVYDLTQVHAAHAALAAALPRPSTIYYSLKANPHARLVAELVRLGCGAEVSSTDELHTALQAGASPAACLYTGPGKTEAELRQAIRLGCFRFSVDSPWDLAKVRAAAADVKMRLEALLRINPETSIPGMGLTMCGAPSQFGADARWVLEEPHSFYADDFVEIVGFQFYMGSNLPDPETMLRAADVALKTARSLVERGLPCKVLDLGGGFGHPFAAPGERPDLSALRGPLEQMLDRAFPAWRAGSPAVAFESGRYLVGAAGRLLATVQDVKRSKGRTFVVLDTGINHLGGMAGLRRVPKVGVVPDCCSATLLHDTDLVGPLCTPLDALARGVSMPQLHPGDVVAIPNVGAYGLTASLIAFLSHEAPVEIVLGAGGDHVAHASRLVLHRATSYEGESHDSRTDIHATGPASPEIRAHER